MSTVKNNYSVYYKRDCRKSPLLSRFPMVAKPTYDTFQFTEKFTIEEGLCPASQIYGDNAEKTQLLRYLRDNLLKTTPEGREIIKLYYQWSPAIVRVMEEDAEFKEDMKEMVDGILEMIEVE